MGGGLACCHGLTSYWGYAQKRFTEQACQFRRAFFVIFYSERDYAYKQ